MHLESNVHIRYRDPATGCIVRTTSRHNRLTQYFFTTLIGRLQSDTPDTLLGFRYRNIDVVEPQGYAIDDTQGSVVGLEETLFAFDSTTVSSLAEGAILQMAHTLTASDFSADIIQIAIATDAAGGYEGTGVDDEVAIVNLTGDPIDPDTGLDVEVIWQIRAATHRMDAEWALTRLIEDDANDIINQITANDDTAGVTLTSMGGVLRVAPSSSLTPTTGTGISLQTVGGATVWEDAVVSVPSGTYTSSDLAIYLRARLAIATLFARETFDEQVPTAIDDHTPDEAATFSGWGGAAWTAGDAKVYEGRLLGTEGGASATLSMYDGTASAYRIVFLWIVGTLEGGTTQGARVGTPLVDEPGVEDRTGHTDVDIDTDGSSQLQLYKNDLIQFADHTDVYRVTEDVTIGTFSSGTVNFTPGLTGNVAHGVTNNVEVWVVGHADVRLPLLVEVYEEDGGNDLIRVAFEPGEAGSIKIEKSTDGGTSWSTQEEVAARALLGTPNTIEINIAADRLVWATLNRQTLVYDAGTGTSWKPRLKFSQIAGGQYLKDLDIYLIR